jgi:hypothetical protein
MESSIEKLIWSIYKIKQKLPKKTDYKPIYNVSSEEFIDGINKMN